MAAIVNPATRRNSAPIVDALRAACPPSVDLKVHLTTRAGEARDLAALAVEADPPPDCLIAVGGDGTVADVAGAVRGTSIPLGIVPAGSTNIVARELGISGTAKQAINTIFGMHRVIALDVGVCNGRTFVHMAGAGVDSRLFRNANPRLKRKLGWIAYLPPTVSSIFARPSTLTVTVDGSQFTVRSPLAIVANGGSIISPRLSIFPGLSKQDGQLDLLLFTASDPIAVLRTLVALARRRLHHSPYVIHRQGQELWIYAEPVLPVQLDGDVVTETPANFQIEPQAIQVLVPA